MDNTAAARSASVFRLALVGSALALVVGFASNRYLARRQRALAVEIRLQNTHRLTPWEYMARGYVRSWLRDDLAKLRYPNAKSADDPEHPVEIFYVSPDKPARVAKYFGSLGKLKLTKTGANELNRVCWRTKVKDYNVNIQVSSAAQGTLIQYSFPDMRLPNWQ